MALKGKFQSLSIGFLVFIISIVWLSPVFAVDITEFVSLNKGRLYYDRRTQINYFTASLTNTSNEILVAPFRVVISEITHSSVIVHNPDGYTENNKPYYEFHSPTSLAPGDVTESKQWNFYNPQRARFNFIIGEITGGVSQSAPTVEILANPNMINSGESSVLTWSSTNADTCTIEPEIGAVGLNGSKAVSPSANTTYTITATGPGGEVTASAAITLLNSAPVANDQSVATNEDTPLSLTLAGSDADNDALVYEIVNSPSSGTLNGSIPNLTYTPGDNYNGNDSFTFMVNDGQADSNTATVSITVNPVNDVPTADAGSDQAIVRTETVILDGTGSSDIDGDTLTYQWSFTSLPSGSNAVLSDSSNVSPSFITDISGVYELELIVNDGNIASSPDTVTITVSSLMVTVPSVANLAQTDAETAISAAGLFAGTITTANSDTVPANSVISQSPTSGTLIVEGSIVDLLISIGPANIKPQVNLTASPAIINQGELSTLSWSSIDGNEAFIEPDIGNVAVEGSIAIAPDHTTTYTITVTGPDGSTSNSVVVSVIGEPETQPAGSFGEQYNDLIPDDATVESYDVKRFALITGQVQDISNNPLMDVRVTIFNHPEYGSAKTDEQGRFAIPVEGGGPVKLIYRKQGYITLHRQLSVPLNDFAIAATIQMITEDPVSTTVTFDGNPNTIITHKSTPVTDEFGTRSCTMIFQGDNQAFLVDENGNDVQALTTITTRATEYTTPESMPAVLPPTSAYTYCAELSVDGAQRVRFTNPVIAWINNFLGFDVGEVVPVGYYDRDKGAWIGSNNGRVVKLLDLDNDGKVDALDASGDNNPDDLNNNGSFSDEVTGLNDETIYLPGATFWRVALSHFTPWDCNWPYAPPLDAISANPKNSPFADIKNCKDCKTESGSYVENRSRIMNEDIPIAGTGMMLHYSSDRVKDYKTIIEVPVSGDSVPSSLERIVVRCEIAGVVNERVIDPLPNQKEIFVWDGLDYNGNTVKTSISAQISIGFEYNLVYTTGNEFGQAWAQVGNSVTGIRGREEIILWKHHVIKVKSQKNTNIAEGWTISSHHQLDAIDLITLYKGDGTRIKNNSIIITTVAGTGDQGGFSGDNGPATQARIYRPRDIVFDQQGNLFFVDSGNHRIRKVDTSGIITTIAGTGSQGFSGDNGPATQARLYHPMGIDLDQYGNLFIADYWNNRIRKVDTNGIITTIVGAGNLGWKVGGYGGDGGPAIEAKINNPTDVALDQQGNLFIADYWNNRIRKVDTSGIITTVAGTGGSGFSGDGGPSTLARLNQPSDVTLDQQGNLFISDAYNHRIRKVDTSGIITTVAGNGTSGYSGDGGLATEAELFYPKGIVLDQQGNLFFADYRNYRIRKVDTRGIITTVAGNGTSGYSGDGGLATETNIRAPHSVTLDQQAKLFFTDFQSHCIRKVGSQTTFLNALHTGDIPVPDKYGLYYIMSSTGNHKKTIDLSTGKTLLTFEYQTFNNSEYLISITDQFDNKTTIKRNVNGTATSIVSPGGIETLLFIDADNNLNDIINPDGAAYQFSYTTGGLLTEKIEPNLNTFNYIYNADGRITETYDGNGGRWLFSRSTDENGSILNTVTTGEGNVTTYKDDYFSTGEYRSEITGPTGGETYFTQSQDGLSAQKIQPCGSVIDIKYDVDPEYKYDVVKDFTESMPSGLSKIVQNSKVYLDTNSDNVPDLITKTLTINNKATSIEHNVLLSQKTITSPLGRIVTSMYNPATLATETTSVSGLFDTTYGYDTKGRMTSMTTGTRQITSTYTVNGFLESITDPKGLTTTYTHDPLGRVLTVTRADQTVIGFDYDANGNMTMLVNPSSIEHRFGTNSVNISDSYQTPLSGDYIYQYDRDRRLISTTFPSGKQINNIYDTDLFERTETPEGNIDYTYLCSSKVDSISKNGESIAYTYDGKLITSETLTGSINQTIEFSYNNDFNTTSITYAGGTENIAYDDDGLLTGMGNYIITRNAQNGLPEAVTGGSLSVARGFNGYGELESQNVTVSSLALSSWNLTHDNNGLITSKTETIAGTVANFIYGYDSMGRLLTVTKDSVLIEEYSYSPNGSREYEMNTLKGITGRALSYSDEDHLLNAGATTYQYDLDGFLTRKDEGTNVSLYNYSSRGELLSVTKPGSTLIEYDHDPMGRRITKKVNGQIVEKYLWQGLIRLLAIYDDTDNLVQRFEYADGRMPILMTQGVNRYYLTYDQVGSLRLVADASGNVIKRIDYDTFGSKILDSNPGFKVPFGFAGGLHDTDTGLVRFGYRDYNPEVGRWTAKDPIGFAGGDTDLYGYVLNDPVNLVDPLGLFHFGKRPLGENGTFGGPGGSNSIADRLNVELAHEHGFFDDGTGYNVGFGPDGQFWEDPTGKNYTYDSTYYDDDIMREALRNIVDGDYSAIGNMYLRKNNCQDWADRLREEYNKILNQMNKQNPCP